MVMMWLVVWPLCVSVCNLVIGVSILVGSGEMSAQRGCGECERKFGRCNKKLYKINKNAMVNCKRLLQRRGFCVSAVEWECGCNRGVSRWFVCVVVILTAR